MTNKRRTSNYEYFVAEILYQNSGAHNISRTLYSRHQNSSVAQSQFTLQRRLPLQKRCEGLHRHAIHTTFYITDWLQTMKLIFLIEYEDVCMCVFIARLHNSFPGLWRRNTVYSECHLLRLLRKWKRVLQLKHKFPKCHVHIPSQSVRF
jgi:hypothetical protein